MERGALVELVAQGPVLSVGILTADLAHLADELLLIESGAGRIVHVDVMDGIFCPALTVGPPVVGAMRTSLLKDVHLLVDDPLLKLDAFVAAGADMLTFHVEGAPQPHRVLKVLGQARSVNASGNGIIRGVAINPGSPLELLEPLLDELEYVLVLAIDPGWGGQSFGPSTAQRLDRVRALIDRSGRPIVLGVDGGVTRENIAQVATMGADVIVSGSAIFDGRDAAANLAAMQQSIVSA